MRDPIRRPGDVRSGFDRAFFGLRDAAQRAVVVGDEKVFAEKEIQFARAEKTPSFRL